MKPFKPQLFPNEVVMIDDMPDKEYLVSVKLDGIRCVFKEGEMLSRSLKQIQNKQLHEKFAHLKDWSREHNTVLDGEIYSHTRTFQEITSIVMTQDKDVPDDIQFWCFDSLPAYNPEMPLKERLDHIPTLRAMTTVTQMFITKKEHIQGRMDLALKDGYEGLILRDPQSKYKFGRVTTKSGDGYKMKNYRTFDAQITGFVQATEVREGAEKKINELGNSVTSKKKDDRVLVPRLAAFLVNYNGVEQKVVYAATDVEKEKAWTNRAELQDKMIEFKGMCEGMKDKIRHPVFVRFRDDR